LIYKDLLYKEKAKGKKENIYFGLKIYELH